MPFGPQPYSLVLSGPHLTLRPTCASFGDLLCTPQLVASSGCSCDTWWFGADCNHVALPVGGGVASTAHPVTANWLREHPHVAEHAISNLNDLQPLQWHFFSFELCRVTGVVMHTVRLRVPSNAVLPLAAASTQKTDLQTRVLNQSSLDEQGVTYSARTGTAMEDLFASTDPVKSDVKEWRLEAVVDFYSLGHGVDQLYIALYWPSTHSASSHQLWLAYDGRETCGTEDFAVFISNCMCMSVLTVGVIVGSSFLFL
eukprot:CAMPEP_0194545528 /NCGR_PEP_ID=MMETSP0253-20130528/89333_1 /TAXON_ID=2966 /ORGANISM="Noctiluca scintillans" /LENGTH=255 /DNA_ID=CAMNT_0039392527 /DNA_START=93 /DNA_END=860 /DNA_ORIENTATION=+